MIFKNMYFRIALWILLIVLILFYLGQLSFLMNFIKTILMITILPLLIASFFYYLLRPLVRCLVKKKLNKTIAVIGVLFVVIALMTVFTIFAGKAITNEYRSFFETLSEYVNEIPEAVEDILDQDKLWGFSLEELKNNLIDASQQVLQTLSQNLAGWITNLTNIASVIILIPIIVFFLLRDDELFYKNFTRMVPEKYRHKVVDILRDTDSALAKYYIGQLIVAGFLGVLTYIGYLIIGLPNALFLSIFSMIFSIIPFLGPIIGVLPAIFIGWTVNLLMIAKVFIVLIITQQLEGNIVLHRTILVLDYCQTTCYPTTGGNGYGNVQHQKRSNERGTAELWFTASVARG
jgi:predicted PurR-regulated permease PerM